jgi:hypothetical protein
LAYNEAPSRREKSSIINDIVDKISESGGFLKKTSDGRWQDIGKFLTNYRSVGDIESAG